MFFTKMAINFKHLLWGVSLSLLVSCSSQNGRYQQKHDSTPVRLPSGSELLDAIPRPESYSRGGNKDYQVRGKGYQVLKSANGFSQTGTASWYGKKFHGHLTSNGEIYNMYSMSAAHKNLPLPTYVKVTNLENNKSVIVRVNDRGPFHQDRIIDLSYSAAYKLDMLKTGTAHVSLTAITDFSVKPMIKAPHQTAVTKSEPSDNLTANFIQVFATRSIDVAKNTANALSSLYQHNVIWPQQDGIFRVQIGPINEPDKLEDILLSLKQTGYPNAYRRKLLQ
ncbi:septal ring lytic transglycosylase RlpA family protein [Colwelliaceae bacterium 6471]